MDAFRTFYGVRGEPVLGLTCSDKSRTRQEFLNESLTSTIMERFAKTGVLTPTINQARIAQFGDFSEVPNDLLDASVRLQSVRETFDDLPAKVRAYFGNSPLAFVQFMHDPRNKSKAVELGLIAKPPASKKEPVAGSAPVVPPVSGSASVEDEGKEDA